MHAYEQEFRIEATKNTAVEYRTQKAIKKWKDAFQASSVTCAQISVLESQEDASAIPT